MSKKTIDLVITEKKKISKEVDFPIYRKHGGLDHGEIYTRIDENLTAVHIGRNYDYRKNIPESCNYEIEFEDKYNFDSSEPDYHLGEGFHKSSREEFEQVLNELKDRIAKISA